MKHWQISVSAAALVVGACAAFAQTPPPSGKSAVEACDAGASVPFDPTAEAPPVHILDIPAEFDRKAEYEALLAACSQAARANPDVTRLMLQLARVSLMGFTDPSVIMPTLRRFADAGSIEATYLLHRFDPGLREIEPDTPAARASLDMLLKAADAGHAMALFEAAYLYGDPYPFAGIVHRDVELARQYARRTLDPPPQGPVGTWAKADEFHARAQDAFALMTLRSDDYSDAERKSAFATVKQEFERGDPAMLEPFVLALRLGRGVERNPAQARATAEAALAKGQFSAVAHLAAMLKAGEGGPADPKRALALLQDEKSQDARGRAGLLAEMLTDNVLVARDPRAAIRVLSTGFWTMENDIRRAALLMDHRERADRKKSFDDAMVKRLRFAAATGEPAAGMALARLKLSDNSDFRDVAGARPLLARIARSGDRDAQFMLAQTWVSNLDTNAFKPSLVSDAPSEKDFRAMVDDGVARDHPGALVLQGKLMRKGFIYAQDDEAATRAFVKAAGLGDIDAMLLAAKAFADGLGVAKDPREKLRWLREAARRGSVVAGETIASSFTFDFGDRLISAREGITVPIAYYGNGTGSRFGAAPELFGAGVLPPWFSGLFGGRANQFPVKALASAVMDGWRVAPAGLTDEKLVPLAKGIPDAVRVEVEKALAAEGKYKGLPQGFFGPEAREALRAWAREKGPLPDDAPPPQSASLASPAATGALTPDIVGAARANALKAVNAAKAERDRLPALKMVNTLARYGDMSARIAIFNNYHENAFVRAAATPAELTRYALDILVTKPPQAPKARFDFTFDITAINQRDRGRAFGQAVLDAIRDDPRLQDLTTLKEIADQMKFAPDACNGVTGAARVAKIPALGDDACEEAGLDAIIAWARKAGPAGVDSKAREAAAPEVARLAK